MKHLNQIQSPQEVIKRYTKLATALLLVLNLSMACTNGTSEVTKKSKKHDDAVQRLQKAEEHLNEEIKEYYEAVEEVNQAKKEEAQTKEEVKNASEKL